MGLAECSGVSGMLPQFGHMYVSDRFLANKLSSKSQFSLRILAVSTDDLRIYCVQHF